MRDGHSPFPTVCLLLLACLTLLAAPGLLSAIGVAPVWETTPVYAQTETVDPARQDSATGESAPVTIINPEGGPVDARGVVTYTNAFFTLGTAAPMVILEDQAGFVDRNLGFILPVESQTLGQITSDFYTSPFSYTISLPLQPQGSLRDVDNDDVDDPGVMVFAVAYWTNIFGDPFLEERDLFGGGWSTAYASTRADDAAETSREIVGGKLLIYSPDDAQEFPTSFGPDGLLFTDDDPVGRVPRGYTVVDLDSNPFLFDRSRHPRIDLIEPETAALNDFSALGYVDAFHGLIDLLAREYAFTEYKEIEWEEVRAEFLPRFERAAAENDSLIYRRALRDLAFAIPDGHVSGPFVVEDFRLETAGGIGMAIRDLDDGRVIVNFLLAEGPAAEAGIELGAEIIAMDGKPVDEYVDTLIAYSAPFSTDHYARLQRLRYAVRFPLGTDVEIVYRNPDGEEESVTLTALGENESFSASSFNVGLDGFELPLEFTMLPSGYGYVQIFSFSDNELLTVQLWERLIRTLKDENVPGLIIDMRQNGGGSGFLADQMAAYFFQEALELGNTGRYDPESGEFFFDPETTERFYLPAEDLRYNGAVAVLTGPNCNSACEFFAYDMTLDGRAAVVGHYPTAGLGGSVDAALMPDNEYFQYTAGRAVDMNGDIHIEGRGVAPTIRVPVTAQTLLTEADPVLDAAVDYLDNLTAVDVISGGPIGVGDVIGGRLVPNARVRYTLAVKANEVIDLFLEDSTGQLDTVLRVYDLADNLLAYNDDDQERNTTNSAIQRLGIPVDLTLIVEVGTYEDGEAGDYTLSVLPGESLASVRPQESDPATKNPPAAADSDPAVTPEADRANPEPRASAVDAGQTVVLPTPTQASARPTASALRPLQPESGPEPAGATAVPTPDPPGSDVTASAVRPVNPASATETPAPTTRPLSTALLPTPTASSAVDDDAAAVGDQIAVQTFGARLSVRSGPGTDFERLVYVQNGSTHTVLEISDDGAWLRIAVPDAADDATGWIAADFTQPADSPTGTAVDAAGATDAGEN